MPCMCGDTHCPSCGPAQGNYRCPICGAWADDCCDHFDEDGHLKPEFHAEAEERARQEALAEEAMVKDLEESERLAEEYWRNYRE